MSNVAAPICGSRNLDIDLGGAASREVVFNSQVWNDDLVINNLKVELLSDRCLDLSGATFGLPFSR